MKKVSIVVVLVIAVAALATYQLTARVKVPESTQPVYSLHTVNDTIWIKMKGQLEPIFILSKMKGPYNGNVNFVDEADTMVLFSGPDSLFVPPMSGTIQFTITSDTDTLHGVFNGGIGGDFKPQLATDKLDLLKRYAAFGTTLPVEGARFTYSPASDHDLARLRTEFHLDSIAGDGDDFSRMWNLCRWMHSRVRHDGNSMNPRPSNAEHIIDVCDQEGRGVNCRMMATALNEFYLAMGFKSRHLTCLPYDTLDQDCHVIDMVWSDQYGKWLYMDPTFDGYWTDAAGVPLGPWEVRQAMLDGDSLVASDSLNWNGQPYSRQQYFNYMAKNLFRFSCPSESAFGYESRDTAGHIELAPSDYNPQLLGTVDHNAKGTRSTYYTDDPEWFFAPPQ